MLLKEMFSPIGAPKDEQHEIDYLDDLKFFIDNDSKMLDQYFFPAVNRHREHRGNPQVSTDIDEITFSSSTTSTVPVRIQLNAGQTGNALQIVNSSGTVLNGFDSSGNLLTGGIDAASLEYEFIMGAY